MDQATALRALMRPPLRRREFRNTRVICIASGKGGVGKTSLTVNLAIALAREGKRAIVLDGDLGLANVDVALGLTPRWTLEHVVSGSRSLADVMVQAPGGIWVIPGGSGLQDLADMSPERREALIAALGELDGVADLLLIDAAAGVSTEVSSFLSAASEVVVVTTPEPTAMTDAYALIKVASRQIQPDIPRTYWLVVNQANDVGEATAVARKIGSVAREFLDINLETLGYVPADRSVGRAIRAQVPLLVAYPSAPASLRIVDLARRLTVGRSPVSESGSGIIPLLRRMAAPKQEALAGAPLGGR